MFFFNKFKLIISFISKITLKQNDIHNKDMIKTLQNKKEISIKLKERAINEGFTISGIASIQAVRA